MDQQHTLNAQNHRLHQGTECAVDQIEDYYHYRLHQYTGRFTPLSLEQYKNKFDRAEAIYNQVLQSRNSYNLTFTRKVERPRKGRLHKLNGVKIIFSMQIYAFR